PRVHDRAQRNAIHPPAGALRAPAHRRTRTRACSLGRRGENAATRRAVGGRSLRAQHAALAARLQPRQIMVRPRIALADVARARLFTYERAADGGIMHEELVERSDLVNPERGALIGSDQHTAQIESAFARSAMAALRELIDQELPQRVIICAGPRML